MTFARIKWDLNSVRDNNLKASYDHGLGWGHPAHRLKNAFHIIMCGNFCHLGHEHCSNYPNDRLEEAEEPGAQVPFREGLPEIEKKETPKILQPRKVEKHSFKKREKG